MSEKELITKAREQLGSHLERTDYRMFIMANLWTSGNYVCIGVKFEDETHSVFWVGPRGGIERWFSLSGSQLETFRSWLR